MRWLWLGIVVVDGDWAVSQQRHSWQPSQILSLSFILAGRCRSDVRIQHRWYRLLSDLITVWHSGQVKVSRLWKVTGITKHIIAGWWIGSSNSEFGMILVDSWLQQLHDNKTCFRHSLYMRLRAVHLRCAVASQTPQVAQLWLSWKTFPH